ALARRRIEQIEHLEVLFRRKRDVQVIDLLARRNLRRFVGRPENRQPAVAEMISGSVVDEPDDFIAELAVLDDLVGDEPAELARTGDENPAQAHARTPAPLEDLAHDLAQA